MTSHNQFNPRKSGQITFFKQTTKFEITDNLKIALSLKIKPSPVNIAVETHPKIKLLD